MSGSVSVNPDITCKQTSTHSKSPQEQNLRGTKVQLTFPAFVASFPQSLVRNVLRRHWHTEQSPPEAAPLDKGQVTVRWGLLGNVLFAEHVLRLGQRGGWLRRHKRSLDLLSSTWAAPECCVCQAVSTLCRGGWVLHGGKRGLQLFYAPQLEEEERNCVASPSQRSLYAGSGE